MCQVRKIPFEEKTISFLLKFGRRTYIFEEIQKRILILNGNVFCSGRLCLWQKCVYFHTWTQNEENCYECRECKACCQVLNISFKDRKLKLIKIGGDCTYCFVKKI